MIDFFFLTFFMTSREKMILKNVFSFLDVCNTTSGLVVCPDVPAFDVNLCIGNSRFLVVEGSSTNRPSVLDGSNYVYWKSIVIALLKPIESKT